MEDFDATEQEPLVLELDVYMRRLENQLKDAYWSDEVSEIETLQKRLQSAKWLAELGETYYVRF